MSIFSKFHDIDVRQVLGLSLMGATTGVGFSYALGKTSIQGWKEGDAGEKQFQQNLREGFAIGSVAGLGIMYSHKTSKTLIDKGFKKAFRDGRLEAIKSLNTKGIAVDSSIKGHATATVGANKVQAAAINAVGNGAVSVADKMTQVMANISPKDMGNFARKTGWGAVTGFTVGGASAPFIYDEDDGPYSKAGGSLLLLAGGTVAGGAIGAGLSKVFKATPSKNGGLGLNNYTKAKERIIHANDHAERLMGGQGFMEEISVPYASNKAWKSQVTKNGGTIRTSKSAREETKEQRAEWAKYQNSPMRRKRGESYERPFERRINQITNTLVSQNGDLFSGLDYT